MESTTAHPSLTTPKPLAWLYAIGAFIGLIASMTLTVEKFELDAAKKAAKKESK